MTNATEKIMPKKEFALFQASARYGSFISSVYMMPSYVNIGYVDAGTWLTHGQQ
jgi:hypothetical protein